jgi:hypothetical protein
MPPDPVTASAAEQARTVVLQMMAERGRGVVARCQLRRRARCLTIFVTRLIVTFALAPLPC